MLSYVIPVDDKQTSVLCKNHLQLELNVQEDQGKKNHPVKNGSVNGISSSIQGKMAPTAVHNFINIEQTQGGILNGGNKKIIKTHGKVNNYVKPAISTESSASSLSSKASDVTSNTSQGGSGSTPTNVVDKLKPKLVQNGATKTTSLKRVSFGSSKGSMVETLIYETPLQEESEAPTPTFDNSNTFSYGEGDSISCDSKKVRVTFFESERPLVVHSPEPGDFIFDLLDAPIMMTSISPNGIQPQYQRQTRMAATSHGGFLYYVVPVPKDGEFNGTDSGWDNPFRPDGDLSREADEIVGLIKEGKPITPTSVNGNLKTIGDELDAVAVAVQSKPQQSAPPGTVAVTTPTKKEGTNGTAKHEKTGVVDVQRTIVSPSAGGEVEPVVIKKKPKCKCCVIQ